jgi:succinate dehydrogenase / fumarate reductase, membrane anchor subunit
LEDLVTGRIVTGAHYGLRDWLAQRITAVIMAVYSVIAVFVLLTGKPITYSVWRDLFAQGWMRVATLLFAASLAWHAWVGMRDILMDYIKPDGLRLSLQVGTLLVIAAYLGWAIQILWR